MNADLTYNSVAFIKQWDDPIKGSSRQSITRGINTPDRILVRSMSYVDSVTKVAGTRFNILLEREDLDGTSQKIKSTAGVTIAVPSTATQAQVDVLVATLKAAVADASLIANVLGSQL